VSHGASAISGCLLFRLHSHVTMHAHTHQLHSIISAGITLGIVISQINYAVLGISWIEG
jgi:hypothetical protein